MMRLTQELLEILKIFADRRHVYITILVQRSGKRNGK